MLRIGAYGGTFDPIHFGHIASARAVVKRFELDKLLIIPAYRPPHKRLNAISGASHRYEMATLALQGEPHMTVSRLEIDAPERPYTVETMARLRATYGLPAKLFFVMGADSFQDIRQWRDYERLLTGYNIIVVTRPGHEVASEHLPPAYRARVIDWRDQRPASPLPDNELDNELDNGNECFIYVIDDVDLDISSTDIRRRLREGESLEGLTPPVVIDYIRTHNLYRQEV